MIRGKRNDAYGRQMLRVDCGGWESYREAVTYIDRLKGIFADHLHAGDFIRQITEPLNL